jgi:hypothetical protein
MIENDSPRLPDICAECGAELMLTPSGHHFCADPTCTDGFSLARPTWLLYHLFDDAFNDKPIKLEKKRRH